MIIRIYTTKTKEWEFMYVLRLLSDIGGASFFEDCNICIAKGLLGSRKGLLWNCKGQLGEHPPNPLQGGGGSVQYPARVDAI